MGQPSMHHDIHQDKDRFGLPSMDETMANMNMWVLIKGQGLGLDGGLGKESRNQKRKKKITGIGFVSCEECLTQAFLNCTSNITTS